MAFAWDQNKNRRNLAKHKISFETAALAFDDPNAISMLERIKDGEERWHTLGSAGGVVLLLVVHADGEEGGQEHIRIISARKATPRERRLYEEAL